MEQLTKRIAELEDALDQVREEAAATAAELADREEQIASQEEALAELESTLQEAAATLAAVQRHFHALIRERAGWLVEEHQLQLPELEPLTEQTEASFWLPFPGMYGGFSYRLQGEDLVTESWSRVVGGSGQRHLVTRDGVRLMEEGFV